MNETSSEPSGTLKDVVEHTAHLLWVDPVLAAEQAQEILNTVPNYTPAVL